VRRAPVTAGGREATGIDADEHIERNQLEPQV
jgi:hypothetical protein